MEARATELVGEYCCRPLPTGRHKYSRPDRLCVRLPGQLCLLWTRYGNVSAAHYAWIFPGIDRRRREQSSELYKCKLPEQYLLQHDESVQSHAAYVWREPVEPNCI